MDIRGLTIDYGLLPIFERFFSEKGFVKIEVPWIVSEEAFRTTLPGPFGDLAHVVRMPGGKTGVLVGSAEQGFLQSFADGVLPEHPLMAVSPCFRADPPDDTHLGCFVKLELAVFGVEAFPAARALPGEIASFHRRRFGLDSRTVGTDIGTDIECDGLELGSYGIRDFMGTPYFYGTGLALPRFQLALAKAGKKG